MNRQETIEIKERSDVPVQAQLARLREDNERLERTARYLARTVWQLEERNKVLEHRLKGSGFRGA